MLEGKKTFILSLFILVGTFAGFYMGLIDAENLKWAITSVCGMVGLREVGDKLLKKE